MSELYDRIDKICKARRTNITALCRMAGVSRSILSELKAGRTKTLTMETAQKLADALQVSLNFLQGDFNGDEPIEVTVSLDALKELAEKEKAPTRTGEREISDDDIKAAFFNGADPTLTPEDWDAMWADAQEYMRWKIAQRRQQQKDDK